jgi:hypothetical protein
MRKRPLLLLVCFGLLCSFLATPAVAAEERSEYEVKAAFLFNFARFVEWPAREGSSADAPIILVIAGTDQFKEVFDRVVQGRTVNGRSIVAKHVADLKNAGPCDILFVEPIKGSKNIALPEALRRTPTLTVGEGEVFCQQGGMIGFVQSEGTIGLAINQMGAERAGLKISSKLLSLATIVNPPEGIDHP